MYQRRARRHGNDAETPLEPTKNWAGAARPRMRIARSTGAPMARRTAIREEPYNAEAPLDAVGGGPVPVGDFFIRSHFPVPAIDPGSWRCRIDGAVRRPATLGLDAIRGLPVRRSAVTLECAGNGRSLLRPEVQGFPWTLGAVSTAIFEGVG